MKSQEAVEQIRAIVAALAGKRPIKQKHQLEVLDRVLRDDDPPERDGPKSSESA